MSTTQETTESCEHCNEELDIESEDTFKSVTDRFWHRDCFAEHCYNRRSLVATEEGSFKIKPVKITETEDGKDKVLESFWRASCPVCYRNHETDERSEEVRSDLVDTVTDCCGAEWLPPGDWIQDCDVCGTSHRESEGCRKLSMREPFPAVDEHRYECAECDWSGDQPDGFEGFCPSCGTTAVRAIPIQ